MKLKEKCFRGMSGAYSAMFTPITKDNKVNEEAIDRMVEYGIANGLTGFYLTGSTGGWFLLTPEERVQVWKRAVQVAKGRCKLIAHVGATSTDESVALAKAAADVGVDWISSVAPPVFCNNFNRTFHHYKRVSEATDLPFMVYSIGAELVPERDIRFFDLKNVKGMKYTNYKYWTVQALRRKLGKEAIFFAGCDEQVLSALATGVFSGCIGTTDNTIPWVYAKICALAAADRFKEAAELQDMSVRFVELILRKPNFTWVKETMNYIGLDCGEGRSPAGRPLAKGEKAELYAALAKLGFVKRNAAR